MQVKEKLYLSVIRNTPRSGPKGFIETLDRLSPVKIGHNIAFRVYRHDLFDLLWNRELTVDEPELELLLRWFRNDHSRERGKAMVRVWWQIHGVEACDITLLFALDRAWEETAFFREQFFIRKEELRGYCNTEFVLDYLSKQPGSAASIEKATGVKRKALNQTFRRLRLAGRIDKIAKGVYRLRGDKTRL